MEEHELPVGIGNATNVCPPGQFDCVHNRITDNQITNSVSDTASESCIFLQTINMEKNKVTEAQMFDMHTAGHAGCGSLQLRASPCCSCLAACASTCIPTRCG